MLCLTRHPGPPLSEFVQDIWLYSGYRPPHNFERLLPSGALEIVINLSDEPLRCYNPGKLELRNVVRGPLLSGVRADFSVVDTHQQREMIGVHFRPGGAHALLDLPVDEVHGLDLPLDDIWGADAGELHDRLLEENIPERRLAILELTLLRRTRADRRLHPVVRSAIARLDQTDVPIEVAGMAAAAGWSSRHFIRTFSEQVGITPKAFGRIRRFQAALRRIPSGNEIDWAGLALTCGYYDQAHFIRDFKSFSGITPGAYRKVQGGHVNHVPIPERNQILPISGDRAGCA